MSRTSFLITNNVISRTTHNLKRIAADKSDESTLAALWFASLVFAMVDPTPVDFRQLAIEIAGRASKIDQYFPYWYSVGVFTSVCYL